MPEDDVMKKLRMVLNQNETQAEEYARTIKITFAAYLQVKKEHIVLKGHP